MNVEVGDLHNGLFAVLDACGISGPCFLSLGILHCLCASFVELKPVKVQLLFASLGCAWLFTSSRSGVALLIWGHFCLRNLPWQRSSFVFNVKAQPSPFLLRPRIVGTIRSKRALRARVTKRP